MFKVGDRVVALEGCQDFYRKGCAGKVVEVFDLGASYCVDFDKVPGVCVNCDGTSVWHVSRLFLEVTPDKADHVISISRSNDPATSKGARRVNKYEQAVLSCLASGPKTGKEMVAICGFPLNSITPRFAPLRRKGLIKPLKVEVGRGVGQVVKRDKQIVWVLA